MKTLLRLTLLPLFALFVSGSQAQSSAVLPSDTTALFDGGPHSKEQAEFNAGELIMSHILDDYGWHVAGDFSIPLPIILYDTERGLKVFSSGRFEHGTKAYDGYMIDDGRIVAVDANGQVDEAATKNIWDVSITRNAFTILLMTLLMVIVFLAVARAYKKRPGMAPKGLQSLLEPVIIFVRDDLGKGSIGEKHAQRLMPYVLTTFFMVLFLNLIGLIPFFPGGANVTGNITVTLTLSVIVLVVVTLNGNRHYWRHIFAMEGVPWPVLLILTPVEILGVFLKPFVLMIRLFANILAGHFVVLSFFSLIFVFGATSAAVGYGISVVSVLFTATLFFLELLVAFIQAYVFAFLTALYLGDAVQEPHHEELQGSIA